MSATSYTIEKYFKKQIVLQKEISQSPDVAIATDKKEEQRQPKVPHDGTASEKSTSEKSTSEESVSEKSASVTDTPSRKIVLDRNVSIKLELMSPELIQELLETPARLRQYADEQSKKYPTPKFAQKTSSKNNRSTQNKRKREKTNLNHSREAKVPRLKQSGSNNKKYSYDLFGMKEKDALDKSILAPAAAPAPSSSTVPSSLLAKNISIASTNDDEITLNNTTSNQSNVSSSSIEAEYLTIELNLLRLCALHKLTHPEVSAGGANDVNEVENVHDEEYVVSKVNQIEFDDTDNVPKFRVEWLGYTDRTWEPVGNIWDCKAFQLFTKSFVYTWRIDLERIWNEMVATIAAESLEPKLSGLEAIHQCKKFNYNDFLAHLFIMARMRDADQDPHSKEFKRVYKFLRREFKYLNYYTRRLQQLQSMKQFQEDINKVDQSKNLQVENEVDLEMPPLDEFIYTNDVIPRDGIDIDDNPPIGCDCADDDACSEKSKCFGQHYDGLSNAKFPYTSRGLLSAWVGPRTPIYECNKKCKCSKNCPNRVVQRGRKQTLAIFKTEERGWGVRTKRQIAQGQYICEYVGEIISATEAERRGKEYDAVGRTYLFDLDFNGSDNPYTVDAAKYGNVSRFINHSCNPNLGVWPVWTDCLEPDLHKLCLFTLRPIARDEELTFDYQQGGSTNEPTTPITNTPNEDGDDAETSADSAAAADPAADTDLKQEGFTCKCGASNCRKTIFL